MVLHTSTTIPATGSIIACYAPNHNARLRLFCFPYAGGGASIYRTWASGLPVDIEVCAIQLPGREARGQEQPFTRLAEMVQAIASGITPWLDKPYAFFGHSMGSHLAFELARDLRRQGDPGPRHLFVSGRHAPQMADPDPPIHHLPTPEFIDELRRLHGTPEEVLQHAELMELLMPILRADFAACETYEYAPEPPLNCPITAFGGLEDASADRDTMLAWREQTSSAFSVQVFPGDHFFLHSARPLLLQTITGELTQLIRRLSGGISAS